MKKFYAIGIVIIIIITVTAGVIITTKGDQTISMNNDFIYLGLFDQSIINKENYVFTDYSDYKNKFNSKKLTAKDFENNNYVLVLILYDACNQKEIAPTNYTINENEINVMVKYKAECGFCTPQYMYYLLKVDKNITSIVTNIEYEAINDPQCDPNIIY